MSNIDESMQEKIASILGGTAVGSTTHLDRAIPNDAAAAAIATALRDDIEEEKGRAIAFHMTDWQADAAFLVAILRCPHRFTDEEIQAGVADFLLHVPNHVAAAAKLYGNPVQEIFDDPAQPQ